mmetsp:Transcript_14726/g.25060  ORF Transcript_14726/g.25060 Transcript_14726/m.25060 type:complete len:122 (+) Transcript_14726:313-678(+)
MKNYAQDDAEKMCEFAKKYCVGDEAESAFNFVHLYYCDFNDGFGSAKVYAFSIFGAVAMYLLMYLLASTADDYLSPSLEFMTIKFGIPESLAGVTLLALGNGAPDVFSSISGAGVSKSIGD